MKKPIFFSYQPEKKGNTTKVNGIDVKVWMEMQFVLDLYYNKPAPEYNNAVLTRIRQTDFQYQFVRGDAFAPSLQEKTENYD